MKIIAALLTFTLASCIDSITVRGRYADYTVIPHKHVIIEVQK